MKSPLQANQNPTQPLPADTHQIPDQERESPIIHPFAFAAFPVVFLATNSFSQVYWPEFLVALAASLLLACVVTLFMSTVFKRRSALCSSYFLLLFYAYGIFTFGLQALCWRWTGIWISTFVLFLAWCFALVAGVVILRSVRIDVLKWTALLNVAGFSAIGVSVALFIWSLFQYPFLFESGKLAMVSALDPQFEMETPKDTPDIYYLVFDRYANANTLRQFYDFDNEPFLRSLTDRGFHVTRDSHANYPQTVLAMSSVLNMQYHDDSNECHKYYASLLQGHLVGRRLKQLGYESHHLGNWYGPLRKNAEADFNVKFYPLHSELMDVICQLMPLQHVFSLPGDSEPERKRFEDVVKVSRHPGPKFVYAHFMLPHPPFMFDADGSELPRFVQLSRPTKENFRNQVVFTNMEILNMIDGILEASTEPPIIIIQADEGPYLNASDAQFNRQDHLEKRTGILSAYFLPTTRDGFEISQSISPVNTFRLVFREYFQASLPLLEDRVFFRDEGDPTGALNWNKKTRLVDVTDELPKSSAFLAPFDISK